MTLLGEVAVRLLFPNREAHGIPVLDGAFSPNTRLDRAEPLGDALAAPDDVSQGPDGALYVSSGDTVVRCEGPDFSARAVFARLPGPVGGLAWTSDGRLLACVSGAGVHALSSAGRPAGLLDHAAGEPILCATGVAVAADGGVYVTEGSRHHRPGAWLHDLMQRRPPSGRLIACDAALGSVRVLASGLDWPAGLVVSHDGTQVWVCESWAHRLLAFDRADGRRHVVVRNHTGYPTRIARAASGGYWMAFMALRTQLVEFVLREGRFRASMMDKVPPELWIAPSLDGRFDYREPTQIGRIKKLGIQKPWAPPRSYGLVARIDGRGEAVESLHSRVDGRVHGVTSAREIGGALVVVSKGRDALRRLPI